MLAIALSATGLARLLLVVDGVTVVRPADGAEESPREVIARQTARGRTADFFDSETHAPREISAADLSSVFANTNLAISPRGLRVANALVRHGLNWLNMDIPCEVVFEGCVFDDGVNFSHSHFQKSLTFTDCVFRGPVDMDSADFSEHVDLRGSSFHEGIDLDFARIGGRFTAAGASFDGDARFREIKVGLSTDFCAALVGVFKFGTNTVSPEDIVKRLVFELGKQGPDGGNPPELRRLRTFPKDDMTPLEEFQWLLVLHADAPIHYLVWQKCYGSTEYSLEVYRRTVLNGEVDFRGASLAGKLLAEDAYFGKQAQFGSLKAGGTIDLNHAVFAGEASFGYVTLTDEFTAEDARFTNGARANFYGLAAGALKLDRAVFEGEATFENARIGHVLSAVATSFLNTNKMVNFYGLKVSGSAYFTDALFEGPVNFILARIAGNFEADGARFRNAATRDELAAITARRPFHFNTDFGGMEVDGFAVLSGASFLGEVSFRNATFRHFHLDPEPHLLDPFLGSNAVRLEGLSYQRIRSITNESFELSGEQLAQSWGHLRTVLRKHAPYSADVYQNLEQYFRREGQTALADEVYIEGRRRERAQMLEPFSFSRCFAWIWNLFLDWTVGYGRRPELALVYSIIVVGIGCVVFKRDVMVEKDVKPDGEGVRDSNYSPFWFSLDLFLPLIGLWDGKAWIPKADRTRVWAYMRMHRILGWILVPIALAAFSGIIK
jgi:hypothetical protein